MAGPTKLVINYYSKYLVVAFSIIYFAFQHLNVSVKHHEVSPLTLIVSPLPFNH